MSTPSRAAFFGRARRVLPWLLAIGCAFAGTGHAQAQTYPSKPIRMLVGFGAGGANDLLGRVLAEKLGAALQQPVVVENVVGAGGTIAANDVARAAPDGYTLLVGSVSNVVISKAVLPSVPFDPVKSFAPVIETASVPLVLTVPASSPFGSVKDLVAAAKARPGTLNFSSGGVGTSVHLAGVLFTHLAGVDMVHVPYNGDNPAVTALLAKDVAMMFAALPSVSARLASGDLKALAVASPKRLSTLPELPTVAEAGVSGDEVVVWHGILAPAHTPRPIVARLNTELAKILAMPDVRKRLQAMGFEPAGGTPEEFAALIGRDMTKWPALVEQSGAKAK
jgi:tripartite-type tricarboxylate transporter receptor subunit TctC